MSKLKPLWYFNKKELPLKKNIKKRYSNINFYSSDKVILYSFYKPISRLIEIKLRNK